MYSDVGIEEINQGPDTRAILGNTSNSTDTFVERWNLKNASVSARSRPALVFRSRISCSRTDVFIIIRKVEEAGTRVTECNKASEH